MKGTKYGKLYGIGVGPGDPKLLTLRAKEILDQADVIFCPIYGYTKDFLFIYKNLAVSKLEKLERLEQLRILENGYSIRVTETKYETIGVDTREDLEKVKQWLIMKSKM